MNILKFFILFFSLTISNSFAFNGTDKPLNVIIPFVPGGGTGIYFNQFQKYALEEKKTNLVALYRGGAEGIVGTSIAEQSDPDGYTALFTNPATLAHYLTKHPDKSFEYVSLIRNSVWALVASPNSKIKNYNDLVDEFKRPNSSISYAYGATSHKLVFTQLFKFNKVKYDPLLVPYKGGSQQMNDLMSGQVDIGTMSYVSAKPYIDSGKLVLLGVMTRNPASNIPNVPVMNKLYPEWRQADGILVVLPKNTSPKAVEFWKNLVQSYMQDTRVQKEFVDTFSEVDKFGPEHAKFVVDKLVESLSADGK